MVARVVVAAGVGVVPVLDRWRWLVHVGGPFSGPCGVPAGGSGDRG